MKKTITMLLAAASVSMGATPLTLSQTPDSTEGITDIYKFAEGTFGADNNATVAITLNVENFCSVLDAATNVVSIFALQGKQTTADSNAAQGMMMDGISSRHPFFTAFATRGTNDLYTVGSFIDLADKEDNANNLSLQKLAWNDYTAISLVFVSNESKVDILQGYLYLMDEQGNITSFYGEAANTRVDICNYTQININSEIVDSFCVYNTNLSESEARQLGESLLTSPTPEPTTTTLSLLALAGMAARRRRK